MTLHLPLPPMRYRFLVGPLDPAHFDNPAGDLIDENIPAENYEAVFDFGCGCGRLARQLLQQRHQPKRYIGIDINRRMIDWCETHIAPHHDGFSFYHHDVFNPLLGQFNQRKDHAPFPVGDGEMTLFIAHSVFTHLVPSQAEFYLAEAARVLRPGGIARISWFFFDKGDFRMMQEFQNALYINLDDPTNAVIFDKTYFETLAKLNHFKILDVVDGYQILTYLQKMSPEEAAQETLDGTTLARMKERPSVARQITGETPAVAVSIPKLNSYTAPSLLPVKLHSQPTELVEPALLTGELFPIAFDIENVGEAAWLCTAPTERELNEMGVTASSDGSGIVRTKLTWSTLGDPQAPPIEAQYDLLQVVPVAQGETARVVFVTPAPAAPGHYMVSLRMTLDHANWPHNGELYSQEVLVSSPCESHSTAPIASQARDRPLWRRAASRLWRAWQVLCGST